MRSAKKIRILIVDDHPVVRVGISAILDSQQDMTVIAEAGNAEEAIELFRGHRPDITIMDLRLGGMSGVECIQAIRSEFSDARFVVLTTYQGDEDIYQALQAGACGYIIKGMPRQQLLEALRRAHQEGSYLPPVVSQALTSRKAESELSSRERQVLGLLVEGKCNKEIASELGIAEATVKCHLSVIFLRLNVTDRTQAVLAALQRGLVHI